jgi:hypothetical protein
MSRTARAGENRCGRLLVAVQGLSGRTYPAGTTVHLVGRGPAVDGWAGDEWVPLRWWEFAEACAVEAPDREPGPGARGQLARERS